jgi:hypothetical protein
MTIPDHNHDSSSSSATNEAVADRLEIEEKRLIVLAWIGTLDKLYKLRSVADATSHQIYIEGWIKDYELGIARVMNELIELDKRITS